MNGEGGRREVAVLAWPLAIGMLSFTVMGVTDTILMGQVSTPAQAGVGLATTLVFAVTAFFRGITSGAQSLVAAADGASDSVRIRQASGAAIGFGAVTGCLALVLVLIVGVWGLPHLSDDQALVSAASDYVWVRAFGLPVSLVAFGLMSALQGIGDTKIRMWASIAGNAVNVVLDCILIFGFGPIEALGASGAALATVGGQLVMCLMYA